MSSTETEVTEWKKIEEKTGVIEPHNVLELLLLTVEECEVLLKHPKLSKNQSKKVYRRIKWIGQKPDRIAARKAKKAQGKGLSVEIINFYLNF